MSLPFRFKPVNFKRQYIQPIFTSATTWSNEPSFPMSIKFLVDNGTSAVDTIDSYNRTIDAYRMMDGTTINSYAPLVRPVTG